MRCAARRGLAATVAAAALAGAQAADLRIAAGPGMPSVVPVERARGPVAVSPGLTGPGQGGATVSFMVDLRDQVDLRQAAAELARAGIPRRRQREWLVMGLTAVAHRVRYALRAFRES